jgi:hypothetical protein
MKYRGIGLLFLIGGVALWACGSFIAGKFKDRANYSNIGHVRITWVGIGYIVGCILSVFGACSALTSLFLIFG